MTLAEVKHSCGRAHLYIAGIAVATQGDPCRVELPETVLPVISEEELNNATIDGKSIKEMPKDIVRFFRGDDWTVEMLEYVAECINQEANK